MKLEFFDPDHWEDIFSHIKKHRVRTLLTAFGVFWGIFLLLLLLAAGRGIEKGAYLQFGSVGVNSIHVWTDRTTVPYKGNKPGRRFNLRDGDTKALRENIAGIRAVCPRLNLWSSVPIKYGKKDGSFRVNGEVPRITWIEPIKIVDGRFVNERDLSEGRKVIVVGTRVVEVLFSPDEDPLGKYIEIGGVSFLVVGVYLYDSFGGDGRQNENIYMPFTTMQRTYNMANIVGWYAILLEDDVLAEKKEAEIKGLLASRHDVHPDDRRAIGSWNSSKAFRSIVGLFTGIRAFLWIVGMGTLLAGIIGVSNIMLIIVQERTKEIGIRKALGASPFSIVSMILQEAFLITAVSGYAGLVSAVMITEGVAWYMKRTNMKIDYFAEPEISLGIALAAMFILILAGTLAGLYPALKAARIHPVEALREE